jgi:multidrug efflux pump
MKNKLSTNFIESFIETCVKQPIIPIVISIFSILFGFVSLMNLEQRNQPKTPVNFFSIYGSSVNPTEAEETDRMSLKIQKKIANLPGINYWKSVSEENVYKIYVSLKDNPNDNARKELESIIASIKLDQNFKPLQIFEENNEGPIFVIDFFAQTATHRENRDQLNESLYFHKLANFLKNVLIPHLKKIKGISNVEIYGQSKSQFCIHLNLLKLSYYGINPGDVNRILNQENHSNTLSPIKTGTKIFNMYNSNGIIDKQSLGNIMIDANRNILLKDISTISIETREKNNLSLLNGKIPTIKLVINKTSNGNPLAVHIQMMALLKKIVPQDTEYKIQNNYENSAIIFNNTKKTCIEAIILLFIILIFFLGSIRILILPLVAIPLSILCTFVFMWQFNLSINEITLMAFLLSIGLLVDDAILIIEKIERERQKFKILNDEIIIRATWEIYKSIIIMTATLFCVFLPIVFLPGEMGYILREFAITISISVLWSCFFSLFLTPMMCKYFMQNYHPFAWTESFLNKLEKWYRNILEFFLRFRIITLFIILSITLSSFILFFFIKTEYYPETKTDNFYIYTNKLNNFKIEFLHKEGEKITKILEKHNNIKHFYLDVKKGSIDIRGKFLTSMNQEIYLEEIIQDLKENIPYIEFLSYGNSTNLSGYLIFSAYENNKVIKENLYKYIAILSKVPEVMGYHIITNEINCYDLVINNDICKSKNISTNDVRNMIIFFFQTHKISGSLVSTDQERYKILMKHDENLANDLNKLKSLSWHINTSRGKQIFTLYELITLVPVIKKKTIERYNSLNCENLQIMFQNNVTAGEACNILRKIQKEVLHKDIYLDFSGSLKTYEENSGQIIYILLACLLSIFLILAMQFNSFFTSILIMLTVPLAFSGAIIILYFYGSINIFSTIGGITLIALITKHGILFMSQKGDVIDVAIERLRPVLMTTTAMILGNIPLLLYKEEAMLPLKQMAFVIVPGLFYGTLMILIIFPILLSFLQEPNNINKKSLS